MRADQLIVDVFQTANGVTEMLLLALPALRSRRHGAKWRVAHVSIKTQTIGAKTPHPRLLCYVPSGAYFVGVRVNGKLIRQLRRESEFHTLCDEVLADFPGVGNNYPGVVTSP